MEHYGADYLQFRHTCECQGSQGDFCCPRKEDKTEIQDTKRKSTPSKIKPFPPPQIFWQCMPQTLLTFGVASGCRGWELVWQWGEYQGVGVSGGNSRVEFACDSNGPSWSVRLPFSLHKAHRISTYFLCLAHRARTISVHDTGEAFPSCLSHPK